MDAVSDVLRLVRLGGAVYLASTLLQRRMMAEVQALVPK